MRAKRPYLKRDDGRVCKISLQQRPIREPHIQCPPEMRKWMYTTYCNERETKEVRSRHLSEGPVTCLACAALPGDPHALPLNLKDIDWSKP